MHDAAQRAALDQFAQGEEIAVPAPVVEHREQPAACACECTELAPSASVSVKGFVDHRRPSASAARASGKVAVVGAGDHHQVEVGAAQQRLGSASTSAAESRRARAPHRGCHRGQHQPGTSAISGAWKVLPAQPQPIRPTRRAEGSGQGGEGPDCGMPRADGIMRGLIRPAEPPTIRPRRPACSPWSSP